MDESTTDHSILKKIEGLVHEEQHLYRKGDWPITIKYGWKPSKSSSISVGICCGNETRGASSARIRMRPRSVRPPSSSGTSSNR
jgi:hypothetical protein